MDEHLNFERHVNKLCSKVSARTGILWRMRSFISEGLAKELYNSLIDPHFGYADIIYDACNQTCKNKLQVHQNAALRAVKNVEMSFNTQRLHDQTGVKWLDIERKERCCIEAYKGLHNLSSNNVNNMFVSEDNVCNTRSGSHVDFKPKWNRTKFADGNLPNRCEQYWRNLPLEVKALTKLNSFKKKVKSGNYFNHKD